MIARHTPAAPAAPASPSQGKSALADRARNVCGFVRALDWRSLAVEALFPLVGALVGVCVVMGA